MREALPTIELYAPPIFVLLAGTSRDGAPGRPVMSDTVSREAAHRSGIPMAEIDRIEAERAIRPSTGTSRSARHRRRQKAGLRPAMVEVDPRALVAAGYLAAESINDREAISAAAQQALRRALERKR